MSALLFLCFATSGCQSAQVPPSTAKPKAVVPNDPPVEETDVAQTQAPVSQQPAEPSVAPLAQVWIENGKGQQITVNVELARTPQERQRGLMYRTELAPDAGMWFDMGRDGNHGFWMKNTYIPLDMIFVTSTGEIAGIVENARPETLKSRRIDRPSRFVLEVNAHFCKQHKIRAGDQVNFSEIAP